MDWDRIRAERVENDDVVQVGALLQRQPGIADDDLTGRATVRKVGEVPLIASDPLDLGIDLIEDPSFAWSRIRCQRSCAEDDSANGLIRTADTGLPDLTDRSFPRVVRQRLVLPHVLPAMKL